MKKSKFTEAQIVFAIKQSETGVSVEEVCRKLGISQATFYNWKKRYGGLDPSELRRLKQLEEENSQLKKIVAELSLDKQMLQDVLKKKFFGQCKNVHWPKSCTKAIRLRSGSVAGFCCFMPLYFIIKGTSVKISLSVRVSGRLPRPVSVMVTGVFIHC